jgi:hypothetical protein
VPLLFTEYSALLFLNCKTNHNISKKMFLFFLCSFLSNVNMSTVFLHHLQQHICKYIIILDLKGKYCPVLLIRKYFQQLGKFCTFPSGRFKRGRHKGYVNRALWLEETKPTCGLQCISFLI